MLFMVRRARRVAPDFFLDGSDGKMNFWRGGYKKRGLR